MLVEYQALRFYDEAMRSPGPVDAAKLRVILQRMNSLLDEIGIPARKIVDDVEGARAAKARRDARSHGANAAQEGTADSRRRS